MCHVRSSYYCDPPFLSSSWMYIYAQSKYVSRCVFNRKKDVEIRSSEIRSVVRHQRRSAVVAIYWILSFLRNWTILPHESITNIQYLYFVSHRDASHCPKHMYRRRTFTQWRTLRFATCVIRNIVGDRFISDWCRK